MSNRTTQTTIKLYLLPVLLLFCLACNQNAPAAMININGFGFSATYDDANLGVLGAPSLSGDGRTLLFSPLQFISSSNGSGGSTYGNQTTSANFQIDITPFNHRRLFSINVIENGDYLVKDRSLTNSPSPANVSVFGSIGLLNLQSGIDVVTMNYVSDDTTNVCSTNFCQPAIWSATTSLSVPDWFGTVRLLLDTSQSAQAYEIGDSAFIEKKHISLSILIAGESLPIAAPLPLSFYLFASAFTGMIFMGRNQFRTFLSSKWH